MPAPAPAPASEAVAAVYDVSAAVASRTGWGRVKRLRFIVTQAADTPGHEEIGSGACKILIDDLKQAACDTGTYKWACSQEAASRLGPGYSLDEKWVAATDESAKVAEAACSRAPLAMGIFHGEHGDPDTAVSLLRKSKERTTDPSASLASLPIAFGADLSKPATRNFINDCCRLLSGPLGEALESSSMAYVQCCDALLNLQAGEFARAAKKFSAISGAHVGNAYSEVLLPRDAGLYGALCSVAALNRKELQSHILNNSSFLPFLECSPDAWKIATDFHAGNYREVLAVLRELQPVLHYDPYLSARRTKLCDAIRTNCLCNYVKPFGRVCLRKMAVALGMTDVDALEDEVATLIGDGKVSMRIDSAEKQMISTVTNKRQQRFQKAQAEGDAQRRDQELMILRANLAARQFLSAPKVKQPAQYGEQTTMAHRDQDEGYELATALAQSRLEQ